MVSDDTTDAKYTHMSLSVAKDSGWYEVDMTSGENFFWGKNEGCSILANTCSHTDVSEFCATEGHSGCNDNFMYRTSCSSSQFTGNCNINLNVKSCKVNHESSTPTFIYGTDSVCLSSQVSFDFKIILSIHLFMKLISSTPMDQEISENVTKSHVRRTKSLIL
jgi:hypothetical protein